MHLPKSVSIQQVISSKRMVSNTRFSSQMELPLPNGLPCTNQADVSYNKNTNPYSPQEIGATKNNKNKGSTQKA